jgi:hypothetical protein
LPALRSASVRSNKQDVSRAMRFMIANNEPLMVRFFALSS